MSSAVLETYPNGRFCDTVILIAGPLYFTSVHCQKVSSLQIEHIHNTDITEVTSLVTINNKISQLLLGVLDLFVKIKTTLTATQSVAELANL